MEIYARGKNVTKAVSIAEMANRKLEGDAAGAVVVHQQTSIGSLKAEDAWDPIDAALDRIIVTRHLPTITIALSLHPLPADYAPSPWTTTAAATIPPA